MSTWKSLSGQHKKIILIVILWKSTSLHILSSYQSGNDYHIFPKEKTTTLMLKKRKKSNNIKHPDINMCLSVLEISFQWLIMNIYSEWNSGREIDLTASVFWASFLPFTLWKEYFAHVQTDFKMESFLLHLLHTCMLKGEEQVFMMIIYQWNLVENLELRSVCLVCTFANVLHWVLFLLFPLTITTVKYFSPSCDQNNYHDAATYHGTIQWKGKNEQNTHAVRNSVQCERLANLRML